MLYRILYGKQQFKWSRKTVELEGKVMSVRTYST